MRTGLATSTFNAPDGHLIAEADGTTGAVLRDYVWLPANDNGNDAAGGAFSDDLAVAGAANNNSPPDLPLAVIDAVNTATPQSYQVHTDHLGRPVAMTDGAKSTVWSATWTPFGEAQSLTGSAVNNLRFPGQYFLIETGHAYNWHRSYDPISGRYTQPDPLRFVDGPGIYAYAGNSPFMKTDREGRSALAGAIPIAGGAALADGPLPFGDAVGICIIAGAAAYEGYQWWMNAEHKDNVRPSTREKHQKGQTRRGKDQGGEKADSRRRPPSKRPPGWKGKWPPS